MNRIFNGIKRPAYTPEFVTELKADEIFVFGSNRAAELPILPTRSSVRRWMRRGSRRCGSQALFPRR